MKRERFEGLVLLGHKEAAVEVPFDPATRWSIPAAPLRPGRRGHAVRGSLNGAEFESAIVPRSKRFWLLLDAGILRSASASAGDRVKVAIEPSEMRVAPRAAGARSRTKNGAAKKSSTRRARDDR